MLGDAPREVAQLFADARRIHVEDDARIGAGPLGTDRKARDHPVAGCDVDVSLDHCAPFILIAPCHRCLARRRICSGCDFRKSTRPFRPGGECARSLSHARRFHGMKMEFEAAQRSSANPPTCENLGSGREQKRISPCDHPGHLWPLATATLRKAIWAGCKAFGVVMVGARGFEPPTPSPPDKHSLTRYIAGFICFFLISWSRVWDSQWDSPRRALGANRQP